MSFYRVSVLDNEGVVAESRTADSLARTAKMMLALAACIGDPWTKPLLDADGELTICVRGAGDRELTDDEKAGLTALLEEFGAFHVAPDDSGGRWGVASPGTSQ